MLGKLFKKKEEVYRLSPKMILACAMSETGFSNLRSDELFDDEHFNELWDTFHKMMKLSNYVK